MLWGYGHLASSFRPGNEWAWRYRGHQISVKHYECVGLAIGPKPVQREIAFPVGCNEVPIRDSVGERYSYLNGVQFVLHLPQRAWQSFSNLLTQRQPQTPTRDYRQEFGLRDLSPIHRPYHVFLHMPGRFGDPHSDAVERNLYGWSGGMGLQGPFRLHLGYPLLIIFMDPSCFGLRSFKLVWPSVW